MTTSTTNLNGDTSRSDTPIASQTVAPNIPPPSAFALKHIDTTSSFEESSSTSSDSQRIPFLLPTPIGLATKSQLSFAFHDEHDDSNGFDPLSPEFANAEILIGPDGTYVETSSGPAARELKRIYDQHYGVGPTIRSPYAITAFVNQHGKQIFRVGHPDLTAPAASATDVELQPKTPSEPSPAPRTKRRSRMSMHAFLPPVMVKNGSSARPITTGPSRKLRKTRSIPDMFGAASSALASATAGPMNRDLHPATPGRAHSRSVTGADMLRLHNPVPGVPRADIFEDIMNWNSPTSSVPNSLSTPSLFSPGETFDPYDTGASSRPIITHPFGTTVHFESPSRRPTSEFLPMPHMLREMQSFESGLTARQDSASPRKGKAKDSPPENGSSAPDPPPPLSSPDSFLQGLPDVEPSRDSTFSPSLETSMHSRYSTDVFDVLQTYRGLPLVDKLDSGETTIIRLSLAADDTAAPRDDPRFVIWGEISSDQDADETSMYQGSLTDLSSAHSSFSRLRSSRAGANGPPEVPSLRLSTSDGPQKLIVAATIERWIAQLTSELNYDELLNFFLTYRTYITATDLCHLLICRFHWALQQPTSPHDETVRRIVRVRSFVAIRYWLLTFFSVDFIPNRELRLMFADWLNTLIRDPILKKHSDGLSIVRKLKKVVKDCKQAHARVLPNSQSKNHISGTIHAKTASTANQPVNHVLGEKFAAATRKLTGDDDSDVDLDFLPPDEAISSGFSIDPANAHLSVAHVGAGFSPTKPTAIPIAPLSLLQQTNRVAAPNADSPFLPSALPTHHNAISRAFVNTIGRLGRWKRVLNSRPPAPRVVVAPVSNVSAFDLDLPAPQDPPTVNGASETYLELEEPRNSVSVAPSVISSRASSTAVPSLSTTDDAPNFSDSVKAPSLNDRPISIADSLDSEFLGTSEEAANAEQSKLLNGAGPSTDMASIRSSSTDSLGAPISSRLGGSSAAFSPFQRPAWDMDVVSIDELDLSDNSSDHHADAPSAPPGLRKLPRRLPLRRDFEFVRQSESVSSMGIMSRESMGSGPSSSAMSSSSAGGLGSSIQQWQMNALVDSLSNEEESGDVEAALRRLEGQINPQKQQEKASKVDGWVRTIQERMAAGDYGDEEPRFPSDDEDEDGEQSLVGKEDTMSARLSGQKDDIEHSPLSSQETSSTPQDDASVTSPSELTHTPLASQTSHEGMETPEKAAKIPDMKPALLDVNPVANIEGRVTSMPSGTIKSSLSSTLTHVEAPRLHRSFILGFRAETLAEHFSMIDRELFMGVKFEELVLCDWRLSEELIVLDWGQFLKERAKSKAESRFPQNLAAVRARFNLIANFTISEVVMTPPAERGLVIGKFIRIAWKAYSASNFNTLVAIIAGLRNDFVSKAMHRHWNRVGIWEMRVFNDLKQYTIHTDDFQYLRRAVDSMIDSKPLDVGSHPASVISTGGTDAQSGKGKSLSDSNVLVPSACVPFIGVYLSQLDRYSKLPDLIDPTAPHEAVGVDPITENFNAPAHPEVFSTLAPLPASMQLEPLINVHKQRLIAGVIKSLVAGQHLASRVQFPIDKRVYQKCLRLRCLDADTLRQALVLYP